MFVDRDWKNSMKIQNNFKIYNQSTILKNNYFTDFKPRILRF